jgi:hypothetical protein
LNITKSDVNEFIGRLDAAFAKVSPTVLRDRARVQV